jgi:hypothetical protein
VAKSKVYRYAATIEPKDGKTPAKQVFVYARTYAEASALITLRAGEMGYKVKKFGHDDGLWSPKLVVDRGV